MTVPVVGFFNNKSGVGTTSLVYHIAWMLSDLGVSVLAADLDPQANLSAALLDDGDIEALWQDKRYSIADALEPLRAGIGDISEPTQIGLPNTGNLRLLLGDLRLSQFEDDLARAWPECLDGNPRAFRVTAAFSRIMQQLARGDAELIVVDVGPNLDAINRAALIACDFVVVPLAPDLFSMSGLKNLGPTLGKWRTDWAQRRAEAPPDVGDLPGGRIQPIGYVVQQHSVRLDRPVQAYEKWLDRIPVVYRESVLEETEPEQVAITSDVHCLALLRDYRSLMPMAQEARKPMFALKVADGAMGAHFQAVQRVRTEYEALAREIARRAGLSVTAPLYLPS